MGKYLQIRVSAFTYRPEDVERAYPRLLALAWPEYAAGKPGVATPKVGVLELTEALADQSIYGDWSKELTADLERQLATAKTLKSKLESALADWKPDVANRLSDELEDALAELETLAPKPEH